MGEFGVSWENREWQPTHAMNQDGNSDERIKRLVERHEALAQSLELLTADVGSLQSSVAGLTETVRTHDEYLSTIMEATSQLLQVAQIHTSSA